jgi:hypothetical protein
MRVRIEEYVPLGALVLKSLKRDIADFNVYFTGKDAGYIERFETLLSELGQLESTYAITAEQKSLTAQLYALCDTAVERLAFLRMYGNRLKLSTQAIGRAIMRLRRRDAEGGVKNVRDAIELYRQHEANLTQNNMPAGFLDDLTALIADIERANNVQNDFFRIRAERMAQNRAVYDEVYRYISEICATGKLIFRGNELKRREYTIRNLMGMLRQAS